MNRKAILLITILLFSSVGTYLFVTNLDDDDIPETYDFDIPSQAWQRSLGKSYSAGTTHVDYGVDDGTFNGAPIGGLGSGSIGRSHRGDFSRWHLDIGNHIYDPVEVNQFSVYIEEENEKHAHVMNTMQPRELTEWNFDMPEGAGTYHALYPRAWYEYDWNKIPLKMVQRQFSPVIPDNYQESSYPVGVFEWEIYNPTQNSLTASIMFTWQNTIFGGSDSLLQHSVIDDNDAITINMARDAELVNKEYDGSFAISAAKGKNYDISYVSTFYLDEAGSLWDDFSSDGILSNTEIDNDSDREMAAALATSFTIAPGELISIPFSLAWDLPITEFGNTVNQKGFSGGETQWYKRYTKFYGTDGRSAHVIATDALGNYTDWEQQIEDWQQPILDDPSRPDWYKTALFNELYYFADGGSMWENGIVDGQGLDPLPEREIGRFAYLETYDYRLYNTFDVHYYSSFALVQLWPELQKSLVYDFIDAVFVNDTSSRYVYSDGSTQETKPYGAVPHDIGNPMADPWYAINDYRWQDSNIWKDLNAKLVLQMYRDYLMTGDEEMLSDHSWEAIYLSLEYLHQFDTDGNHLPDHEGIPDQTYDTWPMMNESAYTGSLWIGALQAAVAIAELRDDAGNVSRYSQWITESKTAFEDLLWTGEYYLFDASGGPVSDSIMSDQLAGQWYMYATGLDTIAPEAHIKSALQKIYDYNVLKFGGGVMGAVNGMRPDGSIDTSAEQSKEVWTGTAYGLASTMLHAGMTDEAWATAYGVYNVVYNMGFWFRTPEAYLENGDFRASMYMRPLSIWGMEYALVQDTTSM